MSVRFLLLGLLSVEPAGAESPIWRPFSADSPWNQRIPAGASSDRDSVALMDDLASRGAWFVNIKDWSIPVYFVDSDRTPQRDVGDLRPGVYGAGFEFPRRIPIPDGAVASPPVGDESDNHLSIVDRTKQLEWGMWAARQDKAGRWFTGLGAVTDLSGSGVAPPWFALPRELDAARGRASGFPLIAGLMRLEEIKAGRIDHALVFAYDHCRTGQFIPPASTAQKALHDAVGTRGIPMGGRIQLDPTWDVEHSGLSAAGQVIARALQEYGAYCGDYADANVFYAENSPTAVEAWKGILRPEELAAVFNPAMIRGYFRVLDMGNLLPGQNLTVPPPYVITFAVAGETTPARIDQLSRTITVDGHRASAMHTTARWTVYPRSTRAEMDGRPISGNTTDIDLDTTTTLVLIAPNGATSHWHIGTLQY